MHVVDGRWYRWRRDQHGPDGRDYRWTSHRSFTTFRSSNSVTGRWRRASHGCSASVLCYGNSMKFIDHFKSSGNGSTTRSRWSPAGARWPPTPVISLVEELEPFLLIVASLPLLLSKNQTVLTFGCKCQSGEQQHCRYYYCKYLLLSGIIMRRLCVGHRRKNRTTDPQRTCPQWQKQIILFEKYFTADTYNTLIILIYICIKYTLNIIFKDLIPYCQLGV